MDKKQELRELIKEFPFLKNVHFCKWAKVSNSEVNMFAAGKRKNMQNFDSFYRFG